MHSRDGVTHYSYGEGEPAELSTKRPPSAHYSAVSWSWGLTFQDLTRPDWLVGLKDLVKCWGEGDYFRSFSPPLRTTLTRLRERDTERFSVVWDRSSNHRSVISK